MTPENVDFFKLLKSVVREQSFKLELCPRAEPVVISCKQLSTLQLKNLIKTAVEDIPGQPSFLLEINKILIESLNDETSVDFNIIDRLLFMLELRSHSLSPTKTYVNSTGEFEVNFLNIANAIRKLFKDDPKLTEDKTATEGVITIKYGIPLVSTENLINEELKKYNSDSEDLDSISKLLADSFIYEIIKSVKTISIQDKATLDLSNCNLKDRIELLEQLPASLIQQIFDYVEKYKNVVKTGLIVNNSIIDINASMFSLD